MHMRMSLSQDTQRDIIMVMCTLAVHGGHNLRIEKAIRGMGIMLLSCY